MAEKIFYNDISTNSYPISVHVLRENYAKGLCKNQPTFAKKDGSKIVRPLTFKENVEAILDDGMKSGTPGFEHGVIVSLSIPDHMMLNSCAGVVYPGNYEYSKFKLVPVCADLINIGLKNDHNYLLLNDCEIHDYREIEGVELDVNKAVYNERLSKSQALEHPGWIALFEEDKALLKAYADFVFGNSIEKGMEFRIKGFRPNERSSGFSCEFSLTYKHIVPLESFCLRPFDKSGIDGGVGAHRGFQISSRFLQVQTEEEIKPTIDSILASIKKG
jgi:hypothetical protein